MQSCFFVYQDPRWRNAWTNYSIQGRGCTVSYCPPFTSCKSCLSRKGCGWCDDRRKCLPGTAFKTDIGPCKSWFYYQCISVGRNPKCSGNIKVIDCDSRLCSDSSTGTNKGTCQQCRDLENCYKNHTVQTGLETTQVCFSWNEVRCPKGFVNKDYQNSNRINNIVASSNVKAVASDEAMLYGCPVEETLIVVVKKGVLDVQVGQIISSTQAEGIFHKVINILNLENYALLLTTASNIEEVVSYSDFSQEIPLQQLAVQESLEDTPDEDLLIDVLLGNVTLNEAMIHAISRGVNIYKCLGHEYVNEDENVGTLYIVIPEYSVNVTLKLGDVLVGNYSHGFLENVVDIKLEEGSAFVHTELTSCRKNGSYGRDYKTLNQEASSCLGGDDLRGLKIVDGDTNVTVGDTIIGRESGPFLGKVKYVHVPLLYNILRFLWSYRDK